jgi:hypothetical protein
MSHEDPVNDEFDPILIDIQEQNAFIIGLQQAQQAQAQAMQQQNSSVGTLIQNPNSHHTGMPSVVSGASLEQ